MFEIPLKCIEPDPQGSVEAIMLMSHDHNEESCKMYASWKLKILFYLWLLLNHSPATCLIISPSAYYALNNNMLCWQFPYYRNLAHWLVSCYIDVVTIWRPFNPHTHSKSSMDLQNLSVIIKTGIPEQRETN